jgi:type II pantothenate kinase
VLGEFWEDGRFRARPEDVCKAALLMVTNQIGQVSLLTAQRLGVRKVLFAGNFLRHNEGSSEAQRRLSWALRYWSGGRTEALFLRREGYYGALGALLLGATARSPSE